MSESSTTNNSREKPQLALYASPKCCECPNLRLYKGYFNIAWFVRAYAEVLFNDFKVITTDETKKAILDVTKGKNKVNEVDEELAQIWGLNDDFKEQWRVPDALDANLLESIGEGFDAQVELAARVAEGEVDRLLMFQDPDDVQIHLPEAYALIRNCTLANVGLNINAGATFWAETQWMEQSKSARNLQGFGLWRTDPKATCEFRKVINPPNQTIAFISHDEEKPKMSRLIYLYRDKFKSEDLKLTGTSGTCQHALEYVAERALHSEVPELLPAGSVKGAGHGPTGGDVVIASNIIRECLRKSAKPVVPIAGNQKHKIKPLVRQNGLTHTIVFYIDHRHAQPHEADIHVLLRTCLHPSHGVNILLNERSAREWAESFRNDIWTKCLTV